MSSNKNTIAIYSNLPSGGANLTYISTRDYLKKYYIIKKLIEPKYKIHNFLEYMYVAIIESPLVQRKLLKQNKHDLLLVYQSWLVKSPSILRYTTKKIIYICHEPLREYYDREYIKLQSIKDRIINILRTPIRILDKINMTVNNKIVIANSNFSKRSIDKVYNVNSIVVHPGIQTKKYRNIDHISKRNQVISIGAINVLKRQEYYIKVIGSMSISIRPSLVLIGNGSDHAYIDQIKVTAQRLNVKVRIIINATEKEKIFELKMSQVFLYAPVSEPFGIVVEEAIASGLPLMLYRYGGGYMDIVSDRNGIILDNLDPNIWAMELELLLKDSNQKFKYSKYNTKYAIENLDSDIMNSKLLKIIRSVL